MLKKRHKKVIIQQLSYLNDRDKLQYFERAWDLMTKAQRQEVFGALQPPDTVRMDAPTLLAAIENFATLSENGHYYRPFMINSKNYMFVPMETQKWFDEIAEYLDAVCVLVEQGEKEIAISCFDILMPLIETMESGDSIVFAHEYGMEMAYTTKDYKKVFAQLCQE
jgi:hypothetical protein